MRIQLAAVSAIIAVCFTTSALAKDCRTQDNIKASTASAAANQGAGGKGGHVNLHMKNATSPLPPSGTQSQLDKTAFKDWTKFKAAFDKWASGTVPKKDAKPVANCGTAGSERDCVKASALGVTEAWKCNKVDSKGLCTSDGWQKVGGELYVGFWYANSSGAEGTKGKWLLNTAYPSTNKDCN